MIVIADTGPVNYLVLVQQADWLPRLFRRVLIPPAVFEELQDPETPIAVREWLSQRPAWLEVQALGRAPDPELDHLDAGAIRAQILPSRSFSLD